MATIGTFTSNGNGFTGTVRTLALNAKARIIRVANPTKKGPHFRIYAGNVELGQPGRRPRTKVATTSRSSWTSRASPLRSMPPWSRSEARATCSSSGPAPIETDPLR